MDESKVLAFLILFVLKICNEVDCGCSISFRHDLASPSPVYIHNGGFLAPSNASGEALVRRAETLRVACPGVRRYVVLGRERTDLQVFDVKCVKDKTFRAVGSQWVGNLSEVSCNAAPLFVSEEVGGCYPGYRLYRVGYKIDSEFHTTYEACFNRQLLHTLYVEHRLHLRSVLLQQGRRPQFTEGGLFGKVKVSKAYEMKNQKERVRLTYGDGMENVYITKKDFLSRGHLAPRADFPQFANQRASFSYVNCVPQWMRGNAGDWAALEDALRRRAVAGGAPLRVLSGSWGALALPRRPRALFLQADENQNDVLPVPLYLFKVVHDPAKKTAVAFVSINSHFFNCSETEALTFCSDVCAGSGNYSWLRWRPADGTHSFCCSYEDFVRKFDFIPKLNVVGLFY